ncbi:MAG: ABC transporter ATP-binding protein [Deltaproteobacteria bacterium]|nr:ABC transporter ATP-binding protein [Deltaproteobacteria bacterium]
MITDITLSINGLSCGYHKKEIVFVDELQLSKGDALTIAGGNGSGKSTFLRTLSGMLSPLRGSVEIDNRDLFKISSIERARIVSLLLQVESADCGLTVKELVSLGRTPYLGRFGYFSKDDVKEVERSVELCDLKDIQDMPLDRISGGERQRARLAMVLAQKTSLVLLDEPSNHLDFVHRQMLYNILENIRDDSGAIVVMVTHNLEDARRFAPRTLFLSSGKTSIFSRDQFESLKDLIVKNTSLEKEWIY